MTILTDLLTLIALAAIPACFNYFLDYCLGHPMSNDPKTGEIFSRYSIWLAERRLDSMKNNIESDRSILRGIYQSFSSMLSNDDPGTRRDGKQQLKQTIMLEAQKYFNIEKALGMCPFCTNFWCSEIAAGIFFFFIPLHFFHPITMFALIPIFAHTILRKF